MIEVRGVTKRYKEKVAVKDLSFEVKQGVVTGFLGPNGSGKSTTMRMIVGLDAPNEGTATINGKSYADLGVPLREVLQPPLVSRPVQRHPTFTRRHGLGNGWTRRRREEAGRKVLPGYGSTVGHCRGALGRSRSSLV